jgi:Lrp/AsnC family transcriptional regulator, leucine-responsive regulatory protein
MLEENARKPAQEIARDLGLTATHVRRRIAYMRTNEVIVGYTVVVNHERIRPIIEAYVELKLGKPEDSLRDLLDRILSIGAEHKDRPVRMASLIAGDMDALVRLRVGNVEDLNSVVTQIRELDDVLSTKTLLVLHRQRPLIEIVSRAQP